MLGRGFSSSVSPHTALWKIYPAGIHRGPSGCDTLCLFLRSIQPAGETASLSGHCKSAAVWSLPWRAKLWRAGGGAVSECFQSGMFQCGALDWHIREVFDTINITKCVHIHMYMMHVWQKKSSPWHIAELWGVSPIQFLTLHLTVTWVRCIADQTHWEQQSRGNWWPSGCCTWRVTLGDQKHEQGKEEKRDLEGWADQSGTSGSWCLTSSIMWALSVIIRRGLIGTRHLTFDNT